MKATIFITIAYGIIAGKSHHLTEEAETAEECLCKLADRLQQKIDYLPTLTFRPHDGMIFCGEMSSTTPIGVLYSQGYRPSDSRQPIQSLRQRIR